ncbi:MAG: Lrp/AsnC family transcriptional regulator regulator for asnA asnC and gidA [Anaerolineaceae bacterium]|nr:MAG: Lrp/AsnC family transcriptional regulator regulator for asnA asnC and gidA [Anaerolineaceae bacterium]
MVNGNGTIPGDLDEIDRQIIAALQKDGREAFAQIAERLGVSPGMIRVRYNRLVEMGVLHVVAITNPLRMGYNTMALIGIKVEGGKLMEAAGQVAALDEVIYLIVVSGAYDIIAEVMCRDREHLLQFLTDRLYKIDGVRESESFMHLKIVKEVYF